jgi:LPS-assembly protein
MCAFPLASFAAEGLKLKPQGSLSSQPPAQQTPAPVYIEADRLEGYTEKEAQAEGNVKLRREDYSVYADRLQFDNERQELYATGNVRAEKLGDTLEGERLRYNLETDRGFMDKPLFQFTPIPGTLPVVPQGGRTRPTSESLVSRGNAERVLFEGPDMYRMEQANYTTCGPGNDDWFIRANELHIDKMRDVGVARGASIVFFDQTILYTPYISFSLNQQRKTGLLTPSYGTSNTSGTEFTVPFYWNIAPNYDMTVYPRVMTKRGLQLSTDFRYLEPQYRGEARIEYLPNDRQVSESRYGYFLKHAQSFSNGWSTGLNINRVSDGRYFADLSTTVAATSTVTLPNEATLARSGAWGPGTYGFSALAQQWQTLQTDPLVPVTPPYNRLPQLTLTGFRQDFLRSDLDVLASYVDFRHPTLVNAKRVLAYPSLTMPIENSYAFVRPKIGMHVTHYAVGPNTQGFEDGTRTLPIFTTEGGLVFERDTKLMGLPLTQTLEPKLYYVYIPYRDQRRLPNFESGVQDVNFATIFTENQFSGHDRINDANQVTVGLTSRLIHPDSGLERMRFVVAQRYYLQGQRVTLPGQAPRPDSTASSDVLAAASGTILPHLIADVGWQYNTDLNRTQKANVSTRYQPAPGKVLNLTYRTTADLTRQTDMSFQWPITSNLTAVGRWNYSLRDKRTLEALGGIEYDGGCWSVRAVAHRFVTALTSVNTSFFVQLELNGVSRIGTNALEVLRRNVGGYSALDPNAPRVGSQNTLGQ